MPIPVANPAPETEPRYVRVQLHSVPMPHGKLSFRIAPIWLARRRVPRPNLKRIEQIQPARQLATLQFIETAHKISVDVVRMIFVLDKRSVGKYLTNSHMPKLPREDFEILHQALAPRNVPGRILLAIVWPAHEQGFRQLLERNFIVAWQQKALRPKRRYSEDRHAVSITYLPCLT